MQDYERIWSCKVSQKNERRTVIWHQKYARQVFVAHGANIYQMVSFFIQNNECHIYGRVLRDESEMKTHLSDELEVFIN